MYVAGRTRRWRISQKATEKIIQSIFFHRDSPFAQHMIKK